MTLELDNIKNQINQYWAGLEQRKKRSIIIIAVILVLFLVSISILLNHKEYVVLYSGLEEREAAEIYTRLKELKAEPQIKGTSTVLVPKKLEAEMRMQLATENYPKTGIHYDLFPGEGGFGQTDSEKRALQIYQLQNNLSETIRFLEGVEEAIVLVAMPETDSFVLKSQQVPVTASIIIKSKSGYKITNLQANSIEQLVAKSVPGLTEDNITIIDSSLNVLNEKSNSAQQTINDQFGMRLLLEDRIKSQVIELLEPVFGYKKVVATVNVKLNYDKRTTESIRFEPVNDDTGIIVSQETLRETINNGSLGGIVGEASNTTTYPEIDTNEGSTYDKTHNIINYEINQIKENLEEQQGKVEDLSISVIIDNDMLDSQSLEQVRGLIATAIGTESNRITVQNMRFDTSLQDELLEAIKKQRPDSIFKLDTNTMLAVGVGGILLLIILFVFILVRRNKKTAVELTEEPIIQPKVEVPMIDFDTLANEQNTLKKQIDKFASQRPDAVAQLLRNWLTDD